MARPSKFNQQIHDKVLELAAKGKTDQQIADIIGVHVNTLTYWKNTKQEFLWSLKEAKQAADDLVEASLFRRAVGYSHPEVKVFNEKGKIVEHEIIKHYPPDPTSMIFWLKNRKPEEYREKRELEIETSKVNIEIAKDESDL